jgi:hypothetical protein
VAELGGDGVKAVDQAWGHDCSRWAGTAILPCLDAGHEK